MTESLGGSTVVVIGGSSGIGFAVASAAKDAGANVVVGSSKAANVETAVQRLGPGAIGWPVDVTNEADVAAFFAKVGPFNHLVYTAGDWGARPGGPPADWDIAAFEGVFAVRFWGAVVAIKHAHRWLAVNGSITLTDGALAHRPRKGAALNSAMLGGIEHLTRSLAIELAPARVNAVCPGLVRTEALQHLTDEQLAKLTVRQPLPRAADPAEVAEAYLYLIRGTFTTGQVLHVDGGYTLI